MLDHETMLKTGAIIVAHLCHQCGMGLRDARIVLKRAGYVREDRDMAVVVAQAEYNFRFREKSRRNCKTPEELLDPYPQVVTKARAKARADALAARERRDAEIREGARSMI